MDNSQQPINFYVRDDGITVFEFHSMERRSADLFAKIITASAENVPDKLRVLYDFSQSPPPTPYFTKIQADLYNNFPHPPDEKSAYVTSALNSAVWVQIVRSYINAKDTMKTFSTQEDAIVWLLEND